MRRLLRWTFHALATASLLLCLATAGLWVRSCWVCDIFLAERRGPPPALALADDRDYGIPSYGIFAESQGGQFAGWFGGSGRPGADPAARWSLQLAHEATGFAAVRPGFGFSTHYEDYDGVGMDLRTWQAPGWAIAGALAVLPAIFAFRQRRAVRRRRLLRLGCCPACAYDLRATPGRCPECGREGG